VPSRPVWPAVLLVIGLALVFASGGWGPVLAAPAGQTAPYLTAFDLVGSVRTPKGYTLADLQRLPVQTQTDTFRTAAGTETHTYRGVLLYDLIQDAGGLALDPSRRNDQLRFYISVQGSDGYEALFAYAEIDPGFGNQPVLVAFEEDGQPLPPGRGAFRMTAPSDTAGGRYVFAVRRITVLSSTVPIVRTGGGFSSNFDVMGAVRTPKTYDLAALQALPTQTLTVTFQSGSGTQTHTERGVLLRDLLADAGGIVPTPNRRNDALRKYISVQATDGYEAIVVSGEFDPNFANKSILVSFEEDGRPLTGGGGFARLVVPGDRRGGRYVSAITRITVHDSEALLLPAIAPTATPTATLVPTPNVLRLVPAPLPPLVQPLPPPPPLFLAPAPMLPPSAAPPASPREPRSGGPAEVPIVPEADAGVLLLGGLVGLAALAWWRRQR